MISPLPFSYFFLSSITHHTHIHLFVCLLSAPRSMRDLGSPTQDGTCIPYRGSAESKPLAPQGSPMPLLPITVHGSGAWAC